MAKPPVKPTTHAKSELPAPGEPDQNHALGVFGNASATMVGRWKLPEQPALLFLNRAGCPLEQ